MLTLLAAATGLDPVQQEYLLQARQMQALSFAVHIPLVCFGVAFPSMVLLLEWLHHRTGDPVYEVLAKRWAKTMLALFAVGVVTGTILSFELGLLWPGFMAAFGDVFGLAFALEGFSFFVEAIFIAIYVYGWNRLSPRKHMLVAVPVVISGVTGSLMVITVNGWMNHPTGFTLRNGHAVDVEPLKALFANSFFWHEFVHMYIAGYVVAGFVVAAVYATAWLRGKRTRYHRIGLAIPLAIAAVAAPAQVVVGDWAARAVAEDQPIKLAALEGLGHTEKGAPEHILGWYTDGEVKYGIRIPYLLSLLAKHNPNATIQGLDSVPAADRPPVNVVRVAFQTMVGIGTAMALLGVGVIVMWWRRRGPPVGVWWLRAIVLAGPASVVALIAGWTTTEVGRQPWVVYGHMRTEAAVTGAGGIPVGYTALVLIYVALGAGTLWMLRRLARQPLPPAATEDAPRVAV